MSCVILTETEIAFDHCVVNLTYPHSTIVDPDHKKVFVNTWRRFIIAFAGIVDPELLRSDEVANLVSTVLDYIHINHDTPTTGLVDMEGDLAKQWKGIFGENQMMLVTKNTRFLLKGEISKLKGYVVKVKEAGSICGIGTGGMYGVGLLEGGTAMDDLFPIIHKLDSFTSALYSVIPLSVLDNKKRRIRR